MKVSNKKYFHLCSNELTSNIYCMQWLLETGNLCWLCTWRLAWYRYTLSMYAQSFVRRTTPKHAFLDHGNNSGMLWLWMVLPTHVREPEHSVQGVGTKVIPLSHPTKKIRQIQSKTKWVEDCVFINAFGWFSLHDTPQACFEIQLNYHNLFSLLKAMYAEIKFLRKIFSILAP